LSLCAKRRTDRRLSPHHLPPQWASFDNVQDQLVDLSERSILIEVEQIRFFGRILGFDERFSTRLWAQTIWRDWPRAMI
jgi:hypothetical protein